MVHRSHSITSADSVPLDVAVGQGLDPSRSASPETFSRAQSFSVPKRPSDPALQERRLSESSRSDLRSDSRKHNEGLQPPAVAPRPKKLSSDAVQNQTSETSVDVVHLRARKPNERPSSLRESVPPSIVVPTIESSSAMEVLPPPVVKVEPPTEQSVSLVGSLHFILF